MEATGYLSKHQRIIRIEGRYQMSDDHRKLAFNIY